MKKITHLIKFFISANILILCALLVAYTMISFVYFYFHLKQDPTGYFSWWYEHVTSFKVMQYKLYIIAFEIILLVVGIVYVSKEK